MNTYSKFKEYIWLVKTIHRYRALSLSEINELWQETDMSEGEPMARTTFFRHRCAIEDMFGINIECDKKNGNKYYIENAEVLRGDTVQNWMLSTLSVGNMVGESQGMHHRILLEHIPSGGNLLLKVIEAMKTDHVVSITYRRYGAEENKEFSLEPYCVKLFSRRWYLLGKFTDSDKFGIFAFDRMTDIKVEETKFTMDKDFDATTYFNDSYGIVVMNDLSPQRVVVRAFGSERYYMRDLPYHHSQRELDSTDEYTDFELTLRITDDFKTKLLSRGQLIQIISPQTLANEIVEWHKNAIKRYNL